MEGGKKATAKGINRNIKDEIITHNDYKNSLFNKEQMTHKMTSIQQESHQIFTMEMEKNLSIPSMIKNGSQEMEIILLVIVMDTTRSSE